MINLQLIKNNNIYEEEMQSINSVYKLNNIVFKEYPYVSPIEYPFSILNKN